MSWFFVYAWLSTDGVLDADLKAFVWELAKEGFVFCFLFILLPANINSSFVLQLISLAGLHSNAVTTGESRIKI